MPPASQIAQQSSHTRWIVPAKPRPTPDLIVDAGPDGDELPFIRNPLHRLTGIDLIVKRGVQPAIERVEIFTLVREIEIRDGRLQTIAMNLQKRVRIDFSNDVIRIVFRPEGVKYPSCARTDIVDTSPLLAKSEKR